MYGYRLLKTTLNPFNALNILTAFSFRWDIQRIREQRMLQRLQQRMEKKKTNVQESEPEVSSFHPDLENGMSLRKINLIKH